jgi:hypothetical protein
MSFGILTLATSHDYRKAIGFALSVRVSNPGVPTAVACSPTLRARLAPFFDHVIDEDPALRGFVHKVHLDRYTPFEDTFFFDADVLVFGDLKAKVEEWNDQPYNVCGSYERDGQSPFGLDRGRVRHLLRKERLVEIGGSGHAYFRKPGCAKVFELAREVTRDYRRYAGDITYADEDVMNIVLTMLDLPPRPHWGFFSCHDSAVPGTLELDATTGRCEMIERSTGRPYRPYIMHFLRNQAPFPYAHQLRRLFSKFGADTSGIYRAAIEDFWDVEVMWRGKDLIRKVLGPRGTAPRLP